MLLLAVALTTLALSTPAHAGRFYWYGARPDCWQTGTNPTSSGEACDYPGGSVISNAITGDLNTTQSGDYCNTYNVTSTICNNEDATWPLSFKYKSACETDSPACGIQHYISFANQNDQPWASWAGGAALVISSELAMTKVKAPTNAWAYLCAVLQAPGSKLFLEDCFDRWQGSPTQSNLPEPPFASRYYGLRTICAGVEVNKEPGAVDQLVTAFAPGAPTPYGTTLAGTTVTGGTTGTNHFEVSISAAQLESAIARDNRSPSESPEGCSRGLPQNASGYRLVGIEDGIEGGGHTQLSATTSNLRAWTEYATPGTPYAFREPATGNEDVFYRGSDGALYQVGWTPSAGWHPAYRIGGTLTSEPMGFIEPNETMNIFYRGANNAIWQYYRAPSGYWSAFEVLPGAPLSTGKPWAYMEPNGTINVFYCSTGHVISQLYYDGSSWHDPGMAVGEAAPCEGDPVAYMQPSGMQNVFYRTTSGTVGQVWWNSEGWHNSPIGGSIVGTPAAMLESNGTQKVVFRTPENTMGQLWWNSSEGWHNTPLGGQVFSNPTAFITPNGTNHIFYVNNYGTIGEWYWEASSGWHNHELGEGAASAPSGFADPGGEQSVFFVQSGAEVLDQWYYNSSGLWSITTVGPGSPP